MLEIDSVHIAFAGKEVLSGCFLQARRGEIVGLLGRNGSGKSSLLKVIFGSVRADFKYLQIDEKIISKGYLSGQVAYLPQQHFMLPFLTIQDIYKDFSSFIKERLREDGLIPRHMEIPVNELSNGQKRFLECLWILSLPADFILLDEPFSAIDPIQSEFIQKIIIETGRDKSVILTDHVYRPLLAVSDRVLLLYNNSIYKIDCAEDLIRYNYITE
jgi:ABC-type multidrug transport system ATPase subunit